MNSTESTAFAASQSCAISRFLVRVGICLTAWVSMTATAAAGTLTLAVPDLPHFAPLLVAEQQGYFASEGLELKVLHCVNGKRCLKHLTDGEAQFAAVADVPIVLAAHAGHLFDILATLATSSNESRVVARTDLGVRSPADLRGKRVGFVNGTTGHYYTEAFLLFHGIAPGAVSRVAMDPTEAVGQLLRGDVAAAGLYQPQVALALQQLGPRGMLLPAPRLYTATINLVSLPVSRGVADADAVKLLRALQRAYRTMRSEPEKTKQFLAERLKLPLPALSAVYDAMDYRLTLDQTLIGTLESESRWAVREGMVTDRTMPDYLMRVRIGPLQLVDPSAVSVVR